MVDTSLGYNAERLRLVSERQDRRSRWPPVPSVHSGTGVTTQPFPYSQSISSSFRNEVDQISWRRFGDAAVIGIGFNDDYGIGNVNALVSSLLERLRSDLACHGDAAGLSASSALQNDRTIRSNWAPGGSDSEICELTIRLGVATRVTCDRR